MCLVVNKKFEKNNEKRTVYKVFVKDYVSGKLFSLYQKVEVKEELGAEGDPQFSIFYEDMCRYQSMGAYTDREILEGGAIHTFTKLEDAREIVKDRMKNYYLYLAIEGHFAEPVIYEVEGTNVIAEGIFPYVNTHIDSVTEMGSVCFKSIKLVREIECV